MAEAIVVGALVSGLFSVVLDRLISSQAGNLIRGKKLDRKLVERLKTALESAKRLLPDAEMKQFRHEEVQDWLNSLRDAVYEADDLLDHVFTEAAILKKVRSFSFRIAAIRKKVRSFSFRIPIINFHGRRMVKKMEAIVIRLEKLEKPKHVVELNETPSENWAWRAPSTSLVGEYIYGREKDQEKIINKLLDDSIEGEISVVSILGIGGIGKTTLAQLVYNDENFIKKFDLKAWVCVSEENDVLKLTKSIINAFTSGTSDKNDLNLLQIDLKEKLSGKKFFVVLDDVWHIDYDGWDNLKKPFLFGAKGSKILVTTRDRNVASTFKACEITLDVLRKEHCWTIFAKHACFPESNGNLELEKIGRDIVKKCKGLPLAIATLGRLLYKKDEIEDWEKILKSDIWQFPLEHSKIVPALLISYYHLPPHLKRCFAYCSLFPKDYKFYKDNLILLWMAEDLLPLKMDEPLENVGCQSFDDLVSRLFFKQFSDNDESFVMHDLLHDLAILVAGDFYIRLEDLGEGKKINNHVRHLSYDGKLNDLNAFDVLDQLKSLRTFMLTYFSSCSLSIESLACSRVSKLKHLRVLSFRDSEEFYELPEFIGELILLRYLDLSGTSIKTLPESLGKLYNLQTLKLYECWDLIKLPSSMQNLVNLRHLDIGETNLKEMPKGMGKLKHLQCLCYFVLSKHKENEIKELGGLSNLRGSLEIRNLNNVSNNGEASEARIMDKKHIHHLHFKWLASALTEADMNTFDKLEPHTNLKELTIDGYRATRFPNWVGVGLSSYRHMTSVCLLNCRHCCKLPSLGQLTSLKSLRIEGLDGLETIGAEFYKNDDDHSLATPFQSLEYLSFRQMDCWVEWLPSESDAFPKLKCLQIIGCRVLTGDLPNHLPALEELMIQKCSRFNGDLPNHLPALKWLEISDCSEFNRVLPNELPALVELLIQNCSGFNGDLPNHLPALKELLIQNCSGFNGDLPNHLPALEKLLIQKCSRFNGDLPNRLPALKRLEISDCSEFNRDLPNELPALETLFIAGHPPYGFPPSRFPRSGNIEIIESNIKAQELWLSLRSVQIEGCKAVGSLFRAMAIRHPSCLQYLKVTSCQCDISFPNGCLPKALETLKIKDCRQLEFPKQQQQRHEALESLEIDNSCDSLTSFTLDVFPNLNTLQIRNCENLESLSFSHSQSQSQHPALHSLFIERCPNFVSFPKEGLAAPNMTFISLYDCKKLKCLPCHMNTLLPKLEKLHIVDCPEIDSFPEGGLPPNLKSLEIFDCEKLLSGLSSMGVVKGLTCLTIYAFGGSESVKSFPKLPLLPSLTTLYLRGFWSVETLECKDLLHLTSLQQLSLYYCPKLENMTGEMLPASLIKLEIDDCPLLEERCENKHPQIWPKISHISSIKVKGRQINFDS